MGGFKCSHVKSVQYLLYNYLFRSIYQYLVVWNRATWDTSQRSQGKFFWSFLYPLFSYFFDLKNYKLRPLRNDSRSFHFTLLFLTYTIPGLILNFSKIGLRQLYKKISQKSVWDNFIKKLSPLVHPYFKREILYYKFLEQISHMTKHDK